MRSVRVLFTRFVASADVVYGWKLSGCYIFNANLVKIITKVLYTIVKIV